ncbi:unnamed protein product [Clonostachys rhizophaga]|uniref:Secreted protein n=1 Tax=Clonostachys rhizophaga TaxID=160324 RepID=A0A9N9YQ52_9HYPO|nr:unnamed protein product [Clonostachys rhizophaga]
MGLLIKGQILALLAGLGLDALLRSKALPFGGFFGLGDGLLSRQVCAGWRKREEDAFLGGAEGAGREQLVDQGLSSVARDLGERLLDGGVVEDDWVGVLCHEKAQVEGVWRGLVDGHDELGLSFHFSDRNRK